MEQTFVNPYLTFKCELAEFKSKSNENLNYNVKENHTEPESELKFQMYAVVEREFIAMDVRKALIENLEKRNEVEKVLSVFVDSRSRVVYDKDNKFLTEANIIIKTKVASKFKDNNF